jgi:hypothetical protein
MAKHFTAGVTSAQWCPYRSHPHLYAVGSYDGSIALWDDRMQRRAPLVSVDSGKQIDGLLAVDRCVFGPVAMIIYIALINNQSYHILSYPIGVLGHVVSGGGVWRLKWKPESNESDDSNINKPLYLGAASMHNGSGIHKIDSDSAFSEDGALTMTTIESQIDSNEARLVYGMDWLPSDALAKEKQTVFENIEVASNISEHHYKHEIATCSFYDNLVQIWSSS